MSNAICQTVEVISTFVNNIHTKAKLVCVVGSKKLYLSSRISLSSWQPCCLVLGCFELHTPSRILPVLAEIFFCGIPRFLLKLFGLNREVSPDNFLSYYSEFIVYY
jgi:hypothetical protein